MDNVYYGNNSTLTVGCNSGYTNIGGVKYTCSNGGWINSGSCMRKCTVSNPSNGYYKLNNSAALANGATVNHGNSITMTCNSGYLLTGSAVATCNNGSWSFSSNNGSCVIAAGCHEYTNQGTQFTFTVPIGVIQVSFEVKGAKGSGNYGGNGGITTGTYNLSVGTKLYGGVNVGGGSSYGSQYGGGASYISKSQGLLSDNTVHTNVLVVAGGGGEGSYSDKFPINVRKRAGDGGGNNDSGTGSVGYNGGTQSSGGKGSNSNGSKGNGGGCLGAGGGGGYYGGGCISTSGKGYGYSLGGGGSAFCGNGVTSCGGTTGGNTSTSGYVRISWGGKTTDCIQN